MAGCYLPGVDPESGWNCLGVGEAGDCDKQFWILSKIIKICVASCRSVVCNLGSGNVEKDIENTWDCLGYGCILGRNWIEYY